MKISQSPLRGSAILYVLVVMAIGGVVLAAWINLLANRVLYVEQLSAGVNRRVTLENSRALATQYFLRNVLPGSHSVAITSSVAGNWGAFTAAAPASGQPLIPLESIIQPAGNNPFAPGGDAGYTVDIPVTLSDGVHDQNWIFQGRSRSPIFSFDLYTAQRPTMNTGSAVNVSAGLHVAENASIWVPNSPDTYGLTAERILTPTVTLPGVSILNGSGNPVLMSNFAFLPITSGNAGSSWGYDGSISVVDSGGVINSLTNRVLSGFYSQVTPSFSGAPVNLGGIVDDGNGTLTINLLDASMQRVIIYGNASTIRLQGHAAAGWNTADDLPGLLIVYVQTASTATRDLATIQLQNENNRRVYFAVKKNTGTGVNIAPSASASPLRWRFAATFENTPVTFSLVGGTLQLQGGIRSDQSISVAGGSVSLVRETDPKLLERHADRITWLESYRQ